MSSTMKVSLLALVSTVVAIPHYGANPHSKFHNSVKVASAVPTGGWSGGYNSTAVPYPTASGSAYTPEDDKTTTIDETATSTETLYSTVIVKPSSAAVVAESADGECGPATITVTASEKVTVTVTPGYTPVAQSSAAVPVVESPAAPVVESSAAPVVESETKTPVAEQATSAPAEYPANTPVAEATTPAAEASTTPAAEYPAETPKAEATTSSKAEVYVAPSYAQKDASSAAPSASASAAPSSVNTYSGTKRGLAYNEASLCKTLGSKFGFGYNWGQVESNDIGTDFVPMMHGPSKSSADEWLANVDKAVKKGTKAVMGFNECDHAEQCNLSPEAACSAWKSYMNPIKSAHPDVSIVGPSVTNGPAPMGLDWLSKFYNACPDAIVHANNIHFYDIYDEGTVDRFKAHVEKAVALNNKPVWVTEFGLNPGATEEQATAFLKDCLAYLDNNSNVQGYSYFMVGSGENQLNSGSGLSKIGELYAAGL